MGINDRSIPRKRPDPIDLGPRVVAPPGRRSSAVGSALDVEHLARTGEVREPLVEVGPVDRRGAPRGGRRRAVVDLLASMGPLLRREVLAGLGIEPGTEEAHQIDVTLHGLVKDDTVRRRGSGHYSVPNDTRPARSVEHEDEPEVTDDPPSV
jgi:hypothetical protein